MKSLSLNLFFFAQLSLCCRDLFLSLLLPIRKSKKRISKCSPFLPYATTPAGALLFLMPWMASL